ncbi:HAMP domain-containing protein [candidate division KSB1 bacterium]|nr:HAMP domain-containing protein [candidate division KSB1 bacterium]
MTAFIIWTLFITITLIFYSIILWKNAKKRSRFHARLAILFFLFILIPTIPLTLFFSVLVSKSTDILVLPGVQRALSESLDVMRVMLNDRKAMFFNIHKDFEIINEETLRAEGVGYIGVIYWSHDYTQFRFLSIDPSTSNTFKPENESLNNFSPQSLFDIYSMQKKYPDPPEALKEKVQDYLHKIQSGGITDSFDDFGTFQVFETFYTLNDTTTVFVGFLLSEPIYKSRHNIIMAKRNYESIGFIGDTFKQQGVIWTFAVLLIILLAGISVYTARAVSRGISEPIRQLAEAMKKIGSGQLTQQVDIKAKDEIKFLVTSFNNMVEELSRNREELQRAERAAAWRDVARQISHEIKNPLTPIQFSLLRIRSSLTKDQMQNTDLRDAFQIIDEELTSMRQMAEEFSEFARMPHLDIHKEDINKIIKNSARLFEGEAPKISIRINSSQDIPLIALDKNQFRRAIHNLLKNAMEASEPGDVIEINIDRCDKEDRTVCVKIIDHGIGMDTEVLEKVFLPYYTTKKRGSGLGLFIVQRIIQDHGGILDIQSKKNKGTIVSITL